MYLVYILRSSIDGSHYYGHTKNIENRLIENRLKAHNGGKVRSTKGKRPWIVIYYEAFQTKSEAYKREMFFKSIDGYNFLKNNNITK